LILIPILILTGCASLPEKIDHDIHTGITTRKQVIDLLGNPQNFTPVQVTYIDNADRCTIDFMDQIVFAISCEVDEKLLAQQRAALEARKEARRAKLQQQAQLHCTSLMNGSYITTHCY
jgi:hypothetical protein